MMDLFWALLGVALVALWLYTIAWVYRDISGRAPAPSSRLMAVLLVVLFNLVGLLAYLSVRKRLGSPPQGA